MVNTSFWKSITVKSQHFPSLTETIEVDVAIIGAGITGITAALHLTDAGKKVAILEAHEVGGVTTSFSTGNLYIPVQPYFQNIASKFDIETAKKIAKSRQFAMDYIEKNIFDKKIACQFSKRPWYLYTDDEKKISFFEKEVNVFKQMDIPIHEIHALPLPLKFKKAAMMENQARFNPLKYVLDIAENLQKAGCLIYENSRVEEMEEKKEYCVLKTGSGKIKAKHIIIATHTPIGINSSQLFTAPYRSYVIAVTLKNKQYPEGHFWDLNSPHHGVCTHSISTNHPELLMVAGNHHKVGQESDAKSHYEELEKFLRKDFDVEEVVYRWSAQHYHAADDVPYVGLASRASKKTYIATGFFADGLLYGTLAGIIIGDLILKKENLLFQTYDSERLTPISSASFLIKEGSNVFLQYLKDFPFRETTDFTKIKKGEGKVVSISQEKCAAFRDENNELHVVSAVCPHMKCILSFNNAEKTWDCPCHGSRFSTEGFVIEGPAMSDLKKIHIKEN